MRNTKTVFKYFTIPQYRQEEDYLSAMNEKGWRFTRATFPGLYHFVKSEPEQVSYRLDYNKEGLRHKDEYVQMFSDCGWDYLCDFGGYTYFRKVGKAGEEREEIFCDDASRLEMMNRVFRGRIIPLILIFVLALLPQLLLHTLGYGGSYVPQRILAILFVILAAVYLAFFAVTAVNFCSFEREVTGDSTRTRLKYTGVFALIVAMIAVVCISFGLSNHSVYDLKEYADGFFLEATRLNTGIEKEYDLAEGDVAALNINALEKGYFYLSIAEEGKDPVFFGDFYMPGENEVTIREPGHYIIQVKGKQASGEVELIIR